MWTVNDVEDEVVSLVVYFGFDRTMPNRETQIEKDRFGIRLIRFIKRKLRRVNLTYHLAKEGVIQVEYIIQIPGCTIERVNHI